MVKFTGRHVTDEAGKSFSGGHGDAGDDKFFQAGPATVADLHLRPPDATRVALISDRGSFVCRLLDVTPLGGGGIDPQARPGRRPLTPYHNPDALGLSMSILIDGHQAGRSVEPRCRILERMAGMF